MQATHKCQECSLQFASPSELLNHKKRFCSNSGFDSLQGLAQKQLFGKVAPTLKRQQNGFLKKYGEYSLRKVGGEQMLGERDLQLDMKRVDKYRRQMEGVKKYKLDNSIVDSLNDSRALNSSKAQSHTTIDPISPSTALLPGSTYSIAKSSHSISPPTYITPGTLPPSMMNRSNTSIQNMPKKQKYTYAKMKLDELNEMKKLYIENGGKKEEFTNGVGKMEVFYQKMLKENEENEDAQSIDRESMIQSRVGTPILKLRDFNQQSSRKSAMNSKKASIAQNSNQNNSKRSNVKDSIIQNESKNPSNNYPPMQYPMQPQIIYLPQQQQSSQNLQLLSKMMQMKSDQNLKLLQILLQQKRKDSKQITPSSVDQVKEEIPNKSTLSKKSQTPYIDTTNPYQFKKVIPQDLLTEQKVLMSLHQQQLDELALISQLPPHLQQLKLKTLMKSSETRHLIQKQILRQKMQRLEWMQQKQKWDQDRKIANDEWAGEQRKKLLGKEMGKYVDGFREQFQNNQDEQ